MFSYKVLVQFMLDLRVYAHSAEYGGYMDHLEIKMFTRQFCFVYVIQRFILGSSIKYHENVRTFHKFMPVYMWKTCIHFSSSRHALPFDIYIPAIRCRRALVISFYNQHFTKLLALVQTSAMDERYVSAAKYAITQQKLRCRLVIYSFCELLTLPKVEMYVNLTVTAIKDGNVWCRPYCHC